MIGKRTLLGQESENSRTLRDGKKKEQRVSELEDGTKMSDGDLHRRSSSAMGAPCSSFERMAGARHGREVAFQQCSAIVLARNNHPA